MQCPTSDLLIFNFGHGKIQVKRLFLGIVAFAFYSQAALANTDLLNLSAYSEGDELPYGEKITVGMVEKTGEKYVTATPSSSGTMKFPVNLAGDFEVAFTVFEDYCCTEYFNLFLTSDELN